MARAPMTAQEQAALRASLPEWFNAIVSDDQLRLPRRQRWVNLVTHADLPLTPTQTLLALVLARCMDLDGITGPCTIEDLQDASKLGRSTVIRTLAQLRKRELITCHEGTQHHPNRYSARLPSKDPFTSEQPTTPPGQLALVPAAQTSRSGTSDNPEAVDNPGQTSRSGTAEPVDNPPDVPQRGSDVPQRSPDVPQRDPSGLQDTQARAGAPAHTRAREPAREPRQPPLVAPVRDPDAARQAALDRLRAAGLPDDALEQLKALVPREAAELLEDSA